MEFRGNEDIIEARENNKEDNEDNMDGKHVCNEESDFDSDQYY